MSSCDQFSVVKYYHGMIGPAAKTPETLLFQGRRRGGAADMPKRSEKRDTAKAEYIERRTRGEKVNLRELAEKIGVSYSTVRKWNTAD